MLIEAQGRERAIHVPVIAARIGCNDRLLQDAVEDMVEIYGLPIGTCGKVSLLDGPARRGLTP
ncbi:MAG: hypothetical protein MZV65_38355 [Chromatiales bacterium]|nr:hypothetical protein [Chromatiales bacterium]